MGFSIVVSEVTRLFVELNQSPPAGVPSMSNLSLCSTCESVGGRKPNYGLDSQSKKDQDGILAKSFNAPQRDDFTDTWEKIVRLKFLGYSWGNESIGSPPVKRPDSTRKWLY